MKKTIDIIFLIIGTLVSVCSALASFIANIDWLQILSWAVLATELIVWAFLSFAWTLCTRIKGLKTLFPPNINGEYAGTLNSDYGEGITKQFKATIEQSLYGITIKIVTDQIVSASSVAKLQKEGGVWKLSFIYSTTSRSENDKETNPESLGGASLVMLEDNFEGSYWTSNKTTGSLRLNRAPKRVR